VTACPEPVTRGYRRGQRQESGLPRRFGDRVATRGVTRDDMIVTSLNHALLAWAFLWYNPRKSDRTSQSWGSYPALSVRYHCE
jgi:hypothetical protein